MTKMTKLVIRQFPDRKKPCICLEQGNQAIVIGTIRNAECEELWRRFFNRGCIAREMEAFEDMGEVKE